MPFAMRLSESNTGRTQTAKGVSERLLISLNFHMSRAGSTSMSAPKRRYAILDGLRGVAAIGVLLYHFGSRLGAPATVRHGYLAVDFFFILSGFVVAHSYTSKLESLSLSSFLLIRVKRFLPLSVMGVALGTAYLMMRWLAQPTLSDDWPQILAASGLNLFLIPKLWMARASADELFPANGVLWSLSLEMAVNLLWAGVFVRARTRTMAIVALAGALVLTAFIQHLGRADIGWAWRSYFGGAGRATFGFFVGVLLWRFRPRIRSWSAVPWISAAALIFVMCMPVKTWWLDVVAILIAFPMIVHFAASSGTEHEQPIFQVLGDLSYPLYAIHLPILMALSGFLKKTQPGMQLGYTIYASAAGMIVMALLVNKYFDVPFRRWLSRTAEPSPRESFPCLQTVAGPERTP
jgi:peptidoglycan/LPS O-acetylase OafA/YrhL